MASLSLQHINKTYPNGFEAVKDFNLEIEDKEFIIFVGPSGCGKSTTLRMVAGLEEITSGTLKIGDNVMNDVEPKDRDIAMVFQNYALYPHMTVYDNMAFGLKLRKVPKDQIDKAVRDLRSRIPAVSANTLANPYLISYKILSTPICDTQPRTVALSSSPKYALQANIATKQAAGIAYPRTLQKKSGIPAHFSVSAV